MRAFIIRPFGTRKGIDFDHVEDELIAPALANIKAEGRTTRDILEAGNIRIDMFQLLLTADLVVADISTNNPNAFYELGIRHALQEKRTFLIRAKTLTAANQTEAERKAEEVPFDLKTDRYLEYDPADPKASLELLSDALRRTMANDRQDSPVFLSLPKLQAQNRERFIPVPLGFGEEVQRAEKEHRPVRLTLLGLEAHGFTWESTGVRVTGKALFFIKEFAAAKTAWESLLKLDEFDLEANISLGNIYQRLDDMTSSDQALARALKSAKTPGDLAEIHSQLGRNRKAAWTRVWAAAADEDKPRLALDSPLLMDAYQQYLTAYRQDLNAYYPGVNALALATMILELAGRFPEIWSSPYETANDAAQALSEVKRKRDQLTSALQLRFDSAGKPEASEEDKKDGWLVSSAGDLSFLTMPDAKRAIYFYKKAEADQADFNSESIRKQWLIFSQLGVMPEKVSSVFKALPAAKPHDDNGQIERLVLFTGHRVDAAGRKSPRFPATPEAIAIAKKAIRDELLEETKLANGKLMLGVSGGANGGDLLFLDLCDELNIPTHMKLALPAGPFVNKSVTADDKTWVEHFYAQLEKHPNPPILAETEELPNWLQFKNHYDIWQRNNLWLLSEALCRVPKNFTLIALWDGETGDGPGGTEHMVRLAEERGARVVHLKTKKLFGL